MNRHFLLRPDAHGEVWLDRRIPNSRMLGWANTSRRQEVDANSFLMESHRPSQIRQQSGILFFLQLFFPLLG
jgi:hypothetical protein